MLWFTWTFFCIHFRWKKKYIFCLKSYENWNICKKNWPLLRGGGLHIIIIEKLSKYLKMQNKLHFWGFEKVTSKCGSCPNYQYADPSPPPSEVAIFTWKICNVLKRTKNQFIRFLQFIFFQLWMFVFTIFSAQKN